MGRGPVVARLQSTEKRNPFGATTSLQSTEKSRMAAGEAGVRGYPTIARRGKRNPGHPLSRVWGVRVGPPCSFRKGALSQNCFLFFARGRIGCERRCLQACTISLSACSRVIIFLFFPVKAVSPGVYFSGPTGALFLSGSDSPDDDLWPGNPHRLGRRGKAASVNPGLAALLYGLVEAAPGVHPA
jgi:hypothetical protein